MISLIISNVVVRQDADGRYCLNDLHKAAGGNRRHLPSRWLENQQAQDLIAEIRCEEGRTGNPVLVRNGGAIPGTWACDDLVIAYATWISPKFYLRVIRAYKASTGKEYRETLGLMQHRMALETRDAASKVRAQFGSGLMNQRKRELPAIKTERAALDAKMQGGLFAAELLEQAA